VDVPAVDVPAEGDPAVDVPAEGDPVGDVPAEGDLVGGAPVSAFVVGGLAAGVLAFAFVVDVLAEDDPASAFVLEGGDPSSALGQDDVLGIGLAEDVRAVHVLPEKVIPEHTHSREVPVESRYR
jgi:hypothetical protein